MGFGISFSLDGNRLIDQIQGYAQRRARYRNDSLIRRHRTLCLHVTPRSWEQLLSVADFTRNALISRTRREFSPESRAYFKATGTLPSFHNEDKIHDLTVLLSPCSAYLISALIEISDDEGCSILRCKYCEAMFDTTNNLEIMNDPIGFVAPRLERQYKAFCKVAKQLGKAVDY